MVALVEILALVKLLAYQEGRAAAVLEKTIAPVVPAHQDKEIKAVQAYQAIGALVVAVALVLLGLMAGLMLAVLVEVEQQAA